MDAATLDPVDELIVAESPLAKAVWVLGRPSLVPLSGKGATAWSDDCRDLTAIPQPSDDREMQHPGGVDGPALQS